MKAFSVSWNKGLLSFCEWFIDNEVINSVFFLSRKKRPPKLSISYEDCCLWLDNIVEYVGCYLDSNLNRESMAHRILKKINTKLNFLWRQSNYLTYSSRRLLCNAFIQPHFDYGCTLWYALLSKTFKTKLQIAQNKCILLLPGVSNSWSYKPVPFQENKPASGWTQSRTTHFHYRI